MFAKLAKFAEKALNNEEGRYHGRVCATTWLDCHRWNWSGPHSCKRDLRQLQLGLTAENTLIFWDQLQAHLPNLQLKPGQVGAEIAVAILLANSGLGESA